MYRQVSRILWAIVLISSIGCQSRPAAQPDQAQTVPSEATKEPEKKKLEESEEIDLSPIEDPPDDFGMGALIEKEEREKQAKKAAAAQKAWEAEHQDGKVSASGRARRTATAVGTKHVERTVSAALGWLAKHQLSDGSWSLHDYTRQCSDKTCTGQSDLSSDAGATALGLLPFLTAGLTHKSKSPYKEHIRKGIEWLIEHQQPDGNLAQGSTQMMYGHGLATMALTEIYGLSSDRQLSPAVQKAVDFIVAAQNPEDGGWGYNPKEPGKTAVFGWQLQTLASAKQAGLKVDGSVITRARKYLDSVAIRGGTEYAYQPGVASSPGMTAVGLLSRQYLGARRDSPMLVGGMKFLLDHLPDEKSPDVYYWYYAQQVMGNLYGYECYTWNCKLRDILVRTQVCDAKSCAHGSWDPAKDAWGKQGGRLMKTCLSVMPLQVYYHYLPFFRPFDADENAASNHEGGK